MTNGKSSLNLVEVGNKAKSKWELYRLLTVEGCLYFPPEDETNMEFISDIFFNEKKNPLITTLSIQDLHSNDVRVCQIPHVSRLRSNNLIKFIVDDCDGCSFLYPPQPL